MPGLPSLSGANPADQLGSAQKLLGDVTGGSSLSVEGAMKMASDYTGGAIDLAKSATSKFGSVSASSSPLDKLVNKLGDPNAPPYTGTDPIVRARLGLPPVEEA
jgi:uncharacterized protein YjbJ (UPF0337 family)